jgi:hypothetical protein
MADQYCMDCQGVKLIWQRGRYWCPGCNPPPKTVDTGRTWKSEPNLQNIPIRTEAGARVRDAFFKGQALVEASPDEPGIGSIDEDFAKIFGFSAGYVRLCVACGNAKEECEQREECLR